MWRGALGIPHGVNEAQYINRRKNEYKFKDIGYKEQLNLCGQVSVAAILASIDSSIDLFDLLETFEKVQWTPNDNKVCNDGKYCRKGTGQDNLRTLINTGYGDYLSASGSVIPDLIAEYWTNKSEEEQKTRSMDLPAKRLLFDRIKQNLMNGYFIIAGITIDGATGKIGVNGSISHWVVITGITDFKDTSVKITYPNGGNGYDYYSESHWVRVYNPFDNETEYYSYEEFRNSWYKDGNMAVLVQPKQQHTGLPNFCRKYGLCCR